MSEAAEKLPDTVDPPKPAIDPSTPISINVQFRVAHDVPPVWVIKTADGKYVRATNGAAFLFVHRRLASRFDSPTWATTIASFVDPKRKPRVKRLWTKSEREATKWNTSAWTWKPKHADNAPAVTGVAQTTETAPSEGPGNE